MANPAPLFPGASFSAATDHLEDNRIISSGGVSLSIIQAEPVLFLQGFSSAEHAERPPLMLRGSLVVCFSKPTKIKTITLTFKGIARTEWPEGLPPKKNDTFESVDIHSHVWPFFNAAFPMAEYSSGAHLVKYAGSSLMTIEPPDNLIASSGDLTAGDDEEFIARSKRGRPNNTNHIRSSSSSGTIGKAAESRNRSSSVDSTSAIKGLASRFKRSVSPQPSTAQSSGGSSVVSSLSGLSLGPHRSYSKKEFHDKDTQSKGYRLFEAGEYIYNFELPLPQSLPESIDCSFGSVKYQLEAVVNKTGAFRHNVSGIKEVQIVRTASDNSVEASEPIAISRDWEDQLHYDIVIGGKAFPIGTSIPIAFKLTPLAKVQCHRVRIYVTENCEYYSKNKKVHRIEPTRKFLLKEETAKEGLGSSLLGEFLGPEISSATELEFMVQIPETFTQRRDILHPNTGFDRIKVHHWIKLVLRLSKSNPEQPDGKRKFYEVSIDSPISLLDNHCTNANLVLPKYVGNGFSRVRNKSTSMFPLRIDQYSAEMSRPIHFLRKPSVAPPPFDADSAPPGANIMLTAPPPNYDAALAAGPPEPISVPASDDDFESVIESTISSNGDQSSFSAPSQPEASEIYTQSTSESASNKDLSPPPSSASRSIAAFFSESSVTDQASVDDDDPLSHVPVPDRAEPIEDDDPRASSSQGSITRRRASNFFSTSNAANEESVSEDTTAFPYFARPSITSSLDSADERLYARRSAGRLSDASSLTESNRYLTRESYARLPLLKDVSDAFSEGDLGPATANDVDDTLSLASTPSLWIT